MQIRFVPVQGAQNIVYGATDSVNTEEKNPATGYFIKNVSTKQSKYKFSETTSKRLWTESMKMCEITL